MGGGLDDGVMCCFRANCFCDSGTTSFIVIGYKQELIEAKAKEATCHRVQLSAPLHAFSLLLVNLWEQQKRMCLTVTTHVKTLKHAVMTTAVKQSGLSHFVLMDATSL